jgi:hypothetical protein
MLSLLQQEAPVVTNQVISCQQSVNIAVYMLCLQFRSPTRCWTRARPTGWHLQHWSIMPH